MAKQPFRLSRGGRIDRGRPLAFSFDGRDYQGYAGDTLASALLANGVRLVGRSFKYHRPRGIFGAGAEEPNALVSLRAGARHEPNVRATQVELFDGLVAHSQNRWPSLQFDIGAVSNLASRLLPAGFYYKTFMWPATWWMRYERVIRAAAGLGMSARLSDPDRYEKCYAHCDVLVTGGGPSGVAAALAAGRAGARVMLVEEAANFGGALSAEPAVIDDAPALDWIARSVAELDALPGVTLLPRATAFGYYDQNLIGVAERVGDYQSQPDPFAPRQRLWRVRAKRVVLATGAIERPLVFGNNDLPGVMLASAARRYLNQYAVRSGERAVVFTNNDSAYYVAEEMVSAGMAVPTLVDVREAGAAQHTTSRLRDVGISVLNGHAVAMAQGVGGLRAVDVVRLNTAGDGCAGSARRIRCDVVCVSGGWNPTVHMHSQAQGGIVYDDRIAAFVPGVARQPECSAGAAAGRFELSACLAEGLRAGAAMAAECGFGKGAPPPAPACSDHESRPLRPMWSVPLPPGNRGKRFIDLQNDVTVDDISMAAREGYRSVEHLKRYTTLGMGTDQGRTSNVNGLAVLAGVLGAEIPSVGTTTFRPMYTPVTVGAFAGREVGERFVPIRRTPMEAWHRVAGAVFVDAGQWRRAQYYPHPGEGVTEAARREAIAVRAGVGIVDISTLGKIEVQGRDAAAFLERVYVNRWRNLAVGRARYGVMLREDGFVFDDGTTTRIAEHCYYMTTTTAHAEPVMRHLEFYAQTVWPDLNVHFTSVTDQWAGIAVAGPDSRRLLKKLVTGLDLSAAAFPLMAYGEAELGGLPVRLIRLTYSGELAYEVHAPADYGHAVWEMLLDAGRPMGITPYGTEAMNVLRIEKGHVVIGAEIDGRTTPDDLGFGRMLKRTPDFVGRRSLERPGLRRPDRKQLVGLKSNDPSIPSGAQVVAEPSLSPPVPVLGHVTSSAGSPTVAASIALALVERGRERIGQTLYASSPLTGELVRVTVTPTVFFDPNGERARG